MRRITSVVVLLAAVSQADPLTWHNDLGRALAAAKESGKPVLAYVFDDY